MTTNQIIDDLAMEIRARLDALDERISDDLGDQRLRDLIAGYVEELEPDAEFVRKIRFAGGDPRLAGSKYGRMGLTVAEIEMAHHILSTAKAERIKGADVSDDLEAAFRAISKGEYLDAVTARRRDQHFVEQAFMDGRLDSDGFKRALDAVDQVHGRAMDTAETGFGLELVGNQYVGDLWAGARAESRVAALIPTFPMTDATAFLPAEAAVPEMLFVAQSTASNSSNYTTSKSGSNRVQVDAKKFVIHQMWSGEMEEDSIIAFLPFLRTQAQRSIQHYSDSLVLNGDTTNAATGNINLDDADPADTKHYLAFDGIRHAALVDATGQGADAAGAVGIADLRSAKGRMVDTTYLHDWGHPNDSNDVVHVCDPETSDRVNTLDEVLTVDKYGPGASVLNGEVGRVLGNPVIASIAMSKTEADGKVSTTGGQNTKGQIATFNRRGFTVGVRRSLRVETERLPATDQARIVYSLRTGFGRFTPTGAASGIKAASVTYNISL